MVQELLGHTDVSTTRICTHGLNRVGWRSKSSTNPVTMP
jgi:hypothetical protein